ncbi:MULTISPECIES: hypothetical protein [unclassified Geodermatophilus]|uniref:hypothetical protein n=1 Tax=unclassified Geodermatophilus TaxID=2637632 RepID=UPI003EE91CBD
MAELDQILRWIESDPPATPAELQRAADALAHRDAEDSARIAAARLRIAVKLERLGL